MGPTESGASLTRNFPGFLPSSKIPFRYARGAKDHLDFLGQVFYKRQILVALLGRVRFT